MRFPNCEFRTRTNSIHSQRLFARFLIVMLANQTAYCLDIGAKPKPTILQNEMVAICRKLLLLLLIRRGQNRSKLKYRKSFWVRPINKKRKQQGEYANLIIYGQEVSTTQNFLKKLILSIHCQQTFLAPPASPHFGVSIFNIVLYVSFKSCHFAFT